MHLLSHSDLCREWDKALRVNEQVGLFNWYTNNMLLEWSKKICFLVKTELFDDYRSVQLWNVFWYNVPTSVKCHIRILVV